MIGHRAVKGLTRAKVAGTLEALETAPFPIKLIMTVVLGVIAGVCIAGAIYAFVAIELLRAVRR